MCAWHVCTYVSDILFDVSLSDEWEKGEEREKVKEIEEVREEKELKEARKDLILKSCTLICKSIP